MIELNYKNLSSNVNISELISQLKPYDSIKIYFTPDYSNDIIDRLLTSLRNLGYNNTDLIRLGYLNEESLDIEDPCLHLIDLDNNSSINEFTIALLSNDINKNYLPFSLTQLDFNTLHKNLNIKEDIKLLHAIYILDNNLTEPLYMLTINELNTDLSKRLLQLSLKIQNILQKDHYDIYIENLFGFKIYHMKLSQFSPCFKLIFFQKFTHKEFHEVKPDFSKTFKENVINFEDQIIGKLTKNIDYGVSLNNELRIIIEHLKFSKTKAELYVGRSSLLKIIYEFIKQEQMQHLILSGDSGSGKTTIMSKLYFDLKFLYPNENLIKIIRHVGLTSASKDIISLLTSIMNQLSQIFDLDLNYEKINDVNRVFNYFKDFVKNVGEKNLETKIFLIIDSLDQLEFDFSTRSVDWFPVDLPSNVKIITSTVNESAFEYLSEIRNLMNSSNRQIQHIDLNSTNFMIDNSSIEKMLMSKLKKHHRKIQDDHKENLFHCFKVSKNLLYVNLMINQALEWKSNSIIDKSKLNTTLDDAINQLFVKVEKIFGKLFTSTVMQYLTLSKNGFNEEILMKIISYDFKLNNISFVNTNLKIRQIISSLNQYFTWPNLKWFHSKITRVATHKYCSKTDENIICHSNIFECFKNEIFISSSEYHLYWLNELVYHAIYSKNIIKLKSELLFNLNFIHSKIRKLNFYELLKDFKLATKVYDDDIGLNVFHTTLLMIMSEIEEHIESFPGQIVARLCDIQHEFNDALMVNLIEQCKFPENLTIISNTKFLTRPEIKSPIICKILQKSFILCTLETHDGNFLITSSEEDCYIRIFFAHNFEYNRSILKKYVENKNLLITKDDEILYTWCKTAPDDKPEFCLIEAFNFKSSAPLFQFYSNSISPIKKFREITNGDEWRTIWMIDEEKWYKINGLNGQIEKQVLIGPNIPKKNDKIAIDTYKNNLIISSNNHTSVVSMDMNGRYVHKSFEYNVEGVRMLVLPNETLLISMSQKLKLKTGVNQTRCYILMCDPITLNVIKEINVSVPLRLIRSSSDSKIITGYSEVKIFVFDIYEMKVLDCLEHSKRISSVSQIDDNTIISTVADYKIYIWNLKSRMNVSARINLFDEFLNINYRFITNEFDTQSPLVLVFNLFKQINDSLFSMFMVYDLNTKQVIKECKIKNLDLLPKYIFKNVLLITFDYQNNKFLFIDIHEFDIFYKIDSIDEHIIKQVTNDTFILHEFDQNEKRIYLIKIHVIDKNNVLKTRLFEWKKVKWSTINYKNLIFKDEEDDRIKVFDFKIGESRNLDKFLDVKINDEIKAYSSNHGMYLVLKIDNKKESYCRLVAYNIQRRKLLYISTLEFDVLKDIMLIDSYLQIKLFENNLNTRYIIDLKSDNIQVRQFSTSSYDIRMLFSDSSINAHSKYIWLTKFQKPFKDYNRSNAHVSVYDKDKFNEISHIDTDFKFLLSNFRVINNGNSLLMRQDKLNEFVILNLQSNKMENNLEFSHYEIENKHLEWTIDGF